MSTEEDGTPSPRTLATMSENSKVAAFERMKQALEQRRANNLSLLETKKLEQEENSNDKVKQVEELENLRRRLEEKRKALEQKRLELAKKKDSPLTERRKVQFDDNSSTAPPERDPRVNQDSPEILLNKTENKDVPELENKEEETEENVPESQSLHVNQKDPLSQPVNSPIEINEEIQSEVVDESKKDKEPSKEEPQIESAISIAEQEISPKPAEDDKPTEISPKPDAAVQIEAGASEQKFTPIPEEDPPTERETDVQTPSTDSREIFPTPVEDIPIEKEDAQETPDPSNVDLQQKQEVSEIQTVDCTPQNKTDNVAPPEIKEQQPDVAQPSEITQHQNNAPSETVTESAAPPNSDHGSLGQLQQQVSKPPEAIKPPDAGKQPENITNDQLINNTRLSSDLAASNHPTNPMLAPNPSQTTPMRVRTNSKKKSSVTLHLDQLKRQNPQSPLASTSTTSPSHVPVKETSVTSPAKVDSPSKTRRGVTPQSGIPRSTKSRRVRSLNQVQSTLEKYRSIAASQGRSNSGRKSDPTILSSILSEQQKQQLAPSTPPPTTSSEPLSLLDKKILEEKERQKKFVEAHGLTENSKTAWTSGRSNSSVKSNGNEPMTAEEKKLLTKSRRLERQSRRMTRQLDVVQSEAQINKQLADFLQSMITLEHEFQNQAAARVSLEEKIKLLEQDKSKIQQTLKSAGEKLQIISERYPTDSDITQTTIMLNVKWESEEAITTDSSTSPRQAPLPPCGTPPELSPREPGMVISGNSPRNLPESRTGLLAQIRKGTNLKRMEEREASTIIGSTALDIFTSLQNTLKKTLTLRQNSLIDSSSEEEEEDDDWGMEDDEDL